MRTGLSPLVALSGVPRIHSLSRRPTIPDPPSEETFDSAFLSELEGLVTDSGITVSSVAPGGRGRARLPRDARGLPGARRARRPAAQRGRRSSRCPEATLAERCNAVIESCRRSPRRDAAQAAESFVVFFQALVPTLGPEPAREVKATFFRLVPTLVQMAWEETAEGNEQRREGERRARAARDDPARGLERAPGARRERAAVQEPRPARDADRRRRVDARARRGRGAAAHDPAQEPRDALAVPPDGGARWRCRATCASGSATTRRTSGSPTTSPALADFGPLRVFEEESPDERRARCSCRSSCRTSRS